MKTKYLLLFLFFGAWLCICGSCKKPVDPIPISELDKLPAATQTGANTFGCLVNGQAFLPHSNSFLSGSYQCNYIYTNGGYYFLVNASNSSTTNYIYSISLSTNALPISEGQTIKLQNNGVAGKACGLYGYLYGTSPTDYETTTVVGGQIFINNFDQNKQIVSGTFFFNAINLSNSKDTIHVTDGRFDMKYTQ
jgi:hypothetical protein